MGQGPRGPRGPGLQYRWMGQGSWVAVTSVGVAAGPWLVHPGGQVKSGGWPSTLAPPFPTHRSPMARLGSSGEVGLALWGPFKLLWF